MTAIGKYPGCVLVSGCQRSGTTMLTRVIAGACGFGRFAFTHDDELDAALILAGLIDLPSDTRYCFQTTYLNEAFGEYGTLLDSQKIIWVLRNPHSVVYSMVYHWRRFALNELYSSAVAKSQEITSLGPFPWPIGPSMIERACIAYAWKTRQIHTIRNLVPTGQLLVTDYQELVDQPAIALGRIFDFIGEPLRPEYSKNISRGSLNKADRLSRRERALIDEIALPAYDECRALISD